MQFDTEDALLKYLNDDLLSGSKLEVITSKGEEEYKKTKFRLMHDLKEKGFIKREITYDWREII
jgi:hypothetical protein